jgi:hypothetical protein
LDQPGIGIIGWCKLKIGTWYSRELSLNLLVPNRATSGLTTSSIPARSARRAMEKIELKGK